MPFYQLLVIAIIMLVFVWVVGVVTGYWDEITPEQRKLVFAIMGSSLLILLVITWLSGSTMIGVAASMLNSFAVRYILSMRK